MGVSARNNNGAMDNLNNKLDKGLELIEKMAKGRGKIIDYVEDEEDAVDGINQKVKVTERELKAVEKTLKSISSAANAAVSKFLSDKDWGKNLRTLAQLRNTLANIADYEKKHGMSKFMDANSWAKEVSKVEDAMAELQGKNKKTSKESTDGQRAYNEELERTHKTLKQIEEVLSKLSAATRTPKSDPKRNGGFLNVKVINSGFEEIVKQMSEAATKYKGGNLFLDGLTSKTKEAEGELEDAAKTTAASVGKAFSTEEIQKSISDSVGKAIKAGVLSGIKVGAIGAVSEAGNATLFSQIADLMGKLDEKQVRRASVNYITDKIFEGEPMSAKQKEAVEKYETKQKYASRAKERVETAKERTKQIEIEEAEETKRKEIEWQGVLKKEEIRNVRAERERQEILNANPEEAARIARNLSRIAGSDARLTSKRNKANALIAEEEVKQAELSTRMMEFRLMDMQDEAQSRRDWTSRRKAVWMDWNNTEARLSQELAYNNGGRQRTPLDDAIEKMQELVAKRHDLEMQARDGVRNTSQQVKNFHDMVKQVKEIAQQQYKLNVKYEEQSKSLKDAIDKYQRMDRYLQAIGNTISGLTRTWNTIGSTIQNIFGRFRNGLMNLFSTGRSELRNLVTEATDQYGKLERAQIGFSNFFGADTSKKLISRIQQEAIAAPALSSGDLADYVAQLAPVSNGNAELALNATMGVLKAIQYSGSDASTEMWRVVTNIRDVMSKGAATTVDIRQFNKAMPAIEKALASMGASEFLQNGQLKITKENAKMIVEMFARLNTDPESPIKNIFLQMGNTLEALKEAWSERKTQAVMNVLNNSGAFDLMKNALITGNNTGMLSKMESFFTEKMKAVINWIKSVDWEKVGTTVKNGFGQIRDAVVTAYNEIKSIIPGVDGLDAMKTGFSAIKKAIEGFAQGIKTTIQTVDNLFGGISPGLIENAASFAGFMLSPVQKLFSSIGSIATSVLSFAQNANKTLGQFGATRLKQYEEYIQKATELQARATTGWMRNANDLKRAGSLRANDDGSFTQVSTVGRQTVYTRGQVSGGMFIEQSYYDKMKKAGVFDTEVKNQIALDRYGKNMDQLSQVQIYRVNAEASLGKASQWWNRALNSFTEQMGKIVNGGQLIAFGSGIKAMADKTNMVTQLLGAAAQSLGIFSATKGVASAIGGALGNAKLGGIVGNIAGTALSILNVVNAWYEADRAEKAKKASEAREQAVNSQVEMIANAAMETWGLDKDKTEQGRYVWDELVKDLNHLAETDMATLLGKGKYGNMEQTMEYYQGQAKILANRFDQSNYMEAIDDFLDKDERELSDKAKAFHAAGGEELKNWGDNGTEAEKEARTWIANMVRELGLISDSKAGGLLSTATDQKVVEAFLEDANGVITTGQLQMLKDEYAEANKLFPTQMDKVKVQLQENSKASDVLNTTMGKLNTNVETIITNGIKLIQNSDSGTVQEMDFNTMSPQEKVKAYAKLDGLWGWFGTSVGFKVNKDKTFDDGTLGVVKRDNNTLKNGEYQSFTDMITPGARDTGVVKGKYGVSILQGLYNALGQRAAEAGDDTDKIEKVSKAYDVVERRSFIGLSAEDTRRLLADVISEIYSIDPWLLMRTGGSILPRMGVDTIPTLLQPGEFVMRRGSVMKAGLGVMSALNRGDLAAAARGLGSRLITGGEFNNSRNWSNVVNNNQRTNNNVFNIVNRNLSARTSTYRNIANRIATV